ncbi:conserved hypothetical protein [Beggiatoa sp. PS]|nr:conserved hypothetical protein [Beggiatoa sp. PS]
MFQRLLDLSRSLSTSAPWERINEGMPIEYNRGFALSFSKQGQWQSVESYNLKENEFHADVIYRSGPSNGTDYTSCCKYVGKTTSSRLLKAVKNLANYPKLPTAQKQRLQTSIDNFERQKDEIWAELEEKINLSEIDGKTKRGFIYWKIDSEKVYEWQATKDFLIQQFLAPFPKGGTHTGTCSVCGQNDLTVYGNVSIVACYNLNNPGSIAGGFIDKQAHRNFPVCEACTIAIAEAFTFAENHLTSSMAGQTYLILPYATNPEIQEVLLESLKEHPERFYLSQEKTTDLVCEELEWLEDFPTDQIALALIFFKIKQASWQIQAEVQQILPSRLHHLKKAVEKIAAADDLFGKDDKPLQITTYTFKQFSGASEKESENTLRTWLVSLFEGHRIDYQHFFHKLVKKIISAGKSDPDKLGWIIRQAWGLYRYALATQLIQLDNTSGETNMPKAIPDSPYGKYIKEHPDFFRRNEIVVAFLTGCYASTVASVQYEERKTTPFTKKFIGRLLSKKQLQKLQTEGYAKLSQYKKLGYVIQKEGKGLDPDLANAWVACGDFWQISDEETTFAFMIGYSLRFRIYQMYSTTDKNAPENLELPFEEEA